MNKTGMINYLKKPDVSKRFYQVPNEIMRLGLSVGEIAVYNYLTSFLIVTKISDIICITISAS